MLDENKEITTELKGNLQVGGQVSAMIPTNLEGAWTLACKMVAGEFVPKSYLSAKNKEAAVFSAILYGMELGMNPFSAVQGIAVINGMPSVWGDAALAIVRNSKNLEFIDETISGSGKDMVATCTVKRIGDPLPHTQTFSMQEAEVAGLTSKDTYKKYPRRMIQMRARAWALRDVFPDAFKGMNIREEAEDLIETTPGVYETKSSLQKAIDAATGPAEKKEKTDEEDIGPWTKSNWFNLRAGDGINNGFGKFVFDNIDSFAAAPEDIQHTATEKWKKLYPRMDWPGQEDQHQHDNDDTGKVVSGDVEVINQILNDFKEIVLGITTSAGISEWLANNGERVENELSGDFNALQEFNSFVDDRLREVQEIEAEEKER